MKQIAKTKYKDSYWLVFYTNFMEGMSTILLKSFSNTNKFNNDIQIVLEDDKGNNLGDAISHFGSYGIENGEWEIMIDTLEDSVQGHLTWKEVEKYFDEKIRLIEKKK